jgi:hypothetical protein
VDQLPGRLRDYLGPAITVSPSEITNEPHRKDKTTDPWLVGLMREGAKMFPALVTRTPSGRLQLLGGERRVAAQIEADVQRIKVYVAHDWTGLVAWLTLDSEEPGSSKMRLPELGEFTSKAQRQLALNVRQVGILDKLLAEVHASSQADIQNTRQLVTRIHQAAEGPERAEMTSDLWLVDQGLLRPSSAISRIVMRRKAAELAAKALPAAEQAKMLVRVMPTLAGALEALKSMGPVSADIPADVRKEVDKAFRQAARQLASIAKQLKHIEESAS